jgi:hypothetical protein
MFWQPGSPNLEAVPDLRFGAPHWRFTFEQYLKDFLHYDPWEYEHLDWLYEEYQAILQS